MSKHKWSNPEHRRQYFRKRYVEKIQHSAHCITCGKPIHKNAKHCRQHIPFGKRENARNWKGGKFYTGDGYIRICKPTHPRAGTTGYVLEHIVIWEEAHKKPLPQNWVIHHLNGIKDDNRPSNLVAFPAMKHRLVLEAKAKRIQELEALLNNQTQLL